MRSGQLDHLQRAKVKIKVRRPTRPLAACVKERSARAACIVPKMPPRACWALCFQARPCPYPSQQAPDCCVSSRICEVKQSAISTPDCCVPSRICKVKQKRYTPRVTAGTRLSPRDAGPVLPPGRLGHCLPCADQGLLLAAAAHFDAKWQSSGRCGYLQRRLP